MKKILQICSYFYPHIGGIEQVARDIVKVLSCQDGIEQKVFCFNETAEAEDYRCQRKETVTETVEGVEVVRCGCFTKVASQSLSFAVGKQLKRVMNEFQPDIVVFHYPNPFLAHFLLQHKKKDFTLWVYWHLDITRQKLMGKLFKGQTKRLIARAEKIIATSPNYIEGSPFLSAVKEKCTVISCAVNVERLQYTDNEVQKAREIREKFAGATLCLGVGRHVPYKGYTYLIQSAKDLPSNIVLLIAGSGVLTAELKAQAQPYANVHFLGRLTDSDLKAYLLACDIFCFPSVTKNEAFGIAMAEAMYFEKPAVTFTIEGSGVNYVNIDGETGIECPNGDSKAYAGALIRLAEDKVLREKYGKNAKKRVLDLFVYDIFKGKIESLLAEANEGKE